MLKALVVEPDAALHVIEERVARQAGYTTLWTDNSDVALRYLREKEPDGHPFTVVVAEIDQLRDIPYGPLIREHGLRLLHKIRTSCPPVAVIGTTMWLPQEGHSYEDRFLREGGDLFFEQPIDPDRLGEALLRLSQQKEIRVNRILLLYLGIDGRIKPLPLVRDSEGHLMPEFDIRTQILIVNRYKSSLLERAEQLEALLAEDPLPEKRLQRFFEQNPDFILDTGYSEALPQVVLQEQSGRKLIPDFILRPNAGVHVPAKIVELKLPEVALVQSYSRGEMFSQRVIRAVGQLRRYHRYFAHDDNRRAFLQKYRFDAYAPRLSLIVGRDIQGLDDETYVDLRTTLSSIDIATYTEVLVNYRQKINQLFGG